MIRASRYLMTVVGMAATTACFAQRGDADTLLQRTLNLPFIQKALDEEGQVVDYKTVILKNDLVPEGITLYENGEPVQILTKEEIRVQKVSRHREYSTVKIEAGKALIRFVPRGDGGVKGALWFEKSPDGVWLVKKIKITQNYRTIVWKEGQKNQKLQKTKTVEVK